MEKLLQLLVDGGVHSGEALGRQLGISRAAVWKKIKGLEKCGLQLQVVKSKGYQLAPGIGLLDKQRIISGLSNEVEQNISLHTALIINSTNDWVCDLAQNSVGSQVPFCTAEYQAQGRGRRGRMWATPFGGAICLSAFWRLGGGTAALEGLSLVVGLAVVKALESCGVKGLGLKWPNDIVWRGRKLAGILLEIHGDPTGECNVVMGVGVNVRLSKEQFELIDQPAADLTMISAKPVDRNRVISAMINSLYNALQRYREHGFCAFRSQWSQYDVFAGQTVVLDVSGTQVIGRALGVSEQGGIIVETEEGSKVFYGGEVTLRAHAHHA